MKKLVALVLAMIMVLGLVACGGGGTSSTPSTPGTPSSPSSPSTPSSGGTTAPAEVKYKERIVVAVNKTLVLQRTFAHNTSMNWWITNCTHDTLIQKDPETGTYHPELATEWNISADGTVYTFKLREGVKFHNGNDFTAADVLFTIKLCQGNSYRAGDVEDIEKVEAPDDYTVVITLKAPNSTFLHAISKGSFAILDEDSVCQEVKDDPQSATIETGCEIGTGPFKQTEWVPNDVTKLERNENYWGEMPKTKYMEFRQITEGAARVIGLQTGEYDFCMGVDAVQVPHVEGDKNCVMLNSPGTNLTYLAIHCQRESNPALMDVRVRKAFNHATDSETLAMVCTEGYGTAHNGIIPPGVEGYYDGVVVPEYDIAKAKALLAEAGYPNGITVGLTTNAASWPGQFELLQAMWAPAGIKLELTTDDGTQRLTNLRAKDFDLLATNWTFGNLNSDMFSIWGSTSGSARTQIKDPHIDDLIEKAKRETDPAKVQQYYNELSQYVVDTNGMIPLYIAPSLHAVRVGVEGYYISSRPNDNSFAYAYAVEK